MRKAQKAQGMVEFALALPILLLLLMGIFAFGHLFFVYSLVVSASREASRYGAAVGETDGGLARYQDCDGILAAAVRVGGVAGVKPGDIAISYDKGPNTSSIGDCPAGGSGPIVDLGDRIDVDVLVHYKPIVPIVNLPEIPLHASTRRTIVKSVSVGEAPDATMPFSVTTTTISQDPPGDSVVGEEVSFYVEVTAVDKNGNWVDSPANEDSIEVSDSDGNVCRLDAPGGYCYFTYYTVGDKTIIARYEGNYADPLYEPSETDEFIHHVNPASTNVNWIFHNPNPSQNGAPVQVKAHVTVLGPGASGPTGPTGVIRFEELDGGSVIGVGCDGALDGNYDATCIMYLTPPRSGCCADLRAYYTGDANYNSSPAVTDRHRVDNGATVTPQPTPTVRVTPTITSTPVMCPSAGGLNFGAMQNGFTLSVLNNDTSHSVTALSVSLTWPETGTPKLQEIHFAPSTGVGCNGGSTDCLWTSGSGLNPPSATANSADNKWDSTLAQMTAGQTKEMRLVFNHNLANGDYSLAVSFSNGCVMTVHTSRLQ